MNLTKLKIIIAREFMSRAKTKTFLLSTLLTPLFIIGITIIPIVITNWDSEEEIKSYAIIDSTGRFVNSLSQSSPEKYFDATNQSIDDLKELVKSEAIAGIIILDNEVYNGNTDPELIYKNGGISVFSDIRKELNKVWIESHLRAENLSPEIQQLLNTRLDIKTSKLTESGSTKEENQFASFGLAYVMAFTIYMALFGYGAIIMRSVLEEKTSRIVEIIISSVKPIELMIGKVLGVGMLGLVQLVTWVLMYTGISIVAAPIYLLFAGKQIAQTAASMPAQTSMPFTLPELELSYIILFLTYYLLGYIMYSSLFAAVGSAADAESDVQHFMFPIMIFIIIPMILLSKVATDPNSFFSVVTSIFPLFSPILMVTRLGVTNVPWWEVALSIVLMIGMIFFLIWMAARIYRVGILMYGKKPTYKELAKWIMYK